ncbi:MAG: DUF6378 domain-containing protein [Pseudomonadota bacterium]
MSKRVELLQEAIELTSGDRNRDYGDPYENHCTIACIFNAMTGHSLTAADIVKVHIATKMARMRTSPGKDDNYIDLMAYAGILKECEDELRNAKAARTTMWSVLTSFLRATRGATR